MHKESGFVPLLIIIPVVIIIFSVIGFGVYFAQTRTSESIQSDNAEPSTSEETDSDTPEAINANTLGAPEIPTPTPTVEPTATPSPLPTNTPSPEPSATPQIEIKEKTQTDKDTCVLLFETSYKLPGETSGCQ